MDSEGECIRALQRVLGGYSRHPNFAGIVIAGLGCETNLISTLMEAQALKEGKFLHTLTIQDVGGTNKALNNAIGAIEEMLPEANKVERVEVPASEIMLALECGGSDSYSGITANPVLGAASDRIVAQGGTVILAETPEIYGAEHLLTRRAVSRDQRRGDQGRRRAGAPCLARHGHRRSDARHRDRRRAATPARPRRRSVRSRA